MEIGLLLGGDTGYMVLKTIVKKHNVVFILTDKKSEKIIQYSSTHNIPLYTNNPRKEEINFFLVNKNIDVLFSINYIYIINENLIKLPKKQALNIHGSLLPKYRGRSPNVWAIINGEKETGVTIHKISNECDAGDIVARKVIKIKNIDTGYSLLTKMLRVYPVLIDKILRDIETDKLISENQDETTASCFNKRTPDDGQIDWSWQKERVMNWVRALSNPYPGAFTFINEEKLIINKISFSDFGFSGEMKNGTILDIKDSLFFVKTSNGVIRIDDYIIDEKHLIKRGIILGNKKDGF